MSSGKLRQHDAASASPRTASPAPGHAGRKPQPASPQQALQRAVAGSLSELAPASLRALQRTVGNRAVQALAKSATPAARNATGLPDGLKAGIESLSGLAMDDVRVHHNSSRPAGVQAHAYAQHPDIHLGPGQEKHLPHEAWHLVQQKQGRVKPTLQAKGVAINDDSALEREADAMGSRSAAMTGNAALGGEELQYAPAAAGLPIQRTKLGTGTLYSAKEYLKWYVSKSPAKDKGAILRAIYEQIGVDGNSVHRTKGLLKNAGVIDDQDIADIERNVDAYVEGGKAALPRERKLLPAGTWRHIWRGDFNAEKHRPTGYHWKGKGDDAWLEGSGGRLNTTGDGFYEQQVEVRDDKVDDIHAATGDAKGNITGKVKADHSTFFPDGWNEADVKDAIELRDSSNKITSKAAAGVTLVKSGETVYPTLD